jgi:hypothetical protein
MSETRKRRKTRLLRFRRRVRAEADDDSVDETLFALGPQVENENAGTQA